MITFICILLLVVSNSLASRRSSLEVELDQIYGILGCRQQCEERRECFDVRYSPFTMRCNLLLKFPRSINSKQTGGLSCRRSHCVTRRIQTRSGHSTSVLERYLVKPRVKVNKSTRKPRVKVIQLSLVTLTKKVCKPSGKHNNILEFKSRVASRGACKAKSKRIFLMAVNYSWVVTGMQEGDKGTFMASFAFISTLNTHIRAKFKLSKSKGIWKFWSKNNKIKTLYDGEAATLEFTHIGDVIRVVDLRKNILLPPIQISRVKSKMRLFITLSCCGCF